MVEFRKKKNENFENFLRRVNRAIQRSQKLMEARSRQFRKPTINKNKQRIIALRREDKRSNLEYLTKIGKADTLLKKR